MRIGQDFPELLRGPFGRRMGGHIEVENPPRADLHCDEDVENLERRGDRHEEIASNTGQQFTGFKLTKLAKDAQRSFTMLIDGVAVPIMFCKPGTYEVGGDPSERTQYNPRYGSVVL
jgi:hypothetical protein